ncbi:MAG: response regulator [Myxococcales bacterium]|nr:response regulator [Myxococcales bacterium]
MLDTLFAGRGEMAALMRARDWSRTPLGPPERWPQSLRMAVRILLTSRFAMWLGWGPELLFFYNDAYRPTLGVKHPATLGLPAQQVWAEIWPAIASRADIVRQGEATWDAGLLLFLERSGYPEETYHTFSYSPLPDDAGAVGGLLCVVSEETERVIGERRLATLRELAARLSTATSTADVYAALARELAAADRDLPFALVYCFEDEGRRARLCVRTGVAADHPAAPEALASGEAWAADLAAEPDVVALDPAVAWPAGPWPTAPRAALRVPIAQPGQAQPAGFLVAGLSPCRPLDDAYRDFIGLVVGQVAASLANAQAYEEERRRAAALAELDRAKTTFFSNVSHEFRTPLTLMLGPLEALAGDRGLPPAAREQLELVHRNGLRLLKLVNTMLDFSRIEAGRVQAAFEPVDLAALTADLASTFRSALDAAGLGLRVDCPPLDQPVFVDRDMWEKIVLNLLSNAFKFTLAGEVAVELRRVGERARLRVIDSGIGIPREAQARVFERFHRLEGSRGRTHEGTGIGLALVQELVKLHAGSIAVESAVDVGSTFTVEVPLGSAHLPPEQVHAAPTRASSSPAAGPTRAAAFREEAARWLPEPEPAPVGDAGEDDARIVLADDNADMRDYLRRLLGERWAVEAVDNGALALAAIRRRRPDLVITDVMMPELDGFGLLAALRADPATHDLPVLVLSARAGEEARLGGLQAGASDYIVKPFSARELVARVEALVLRGRLRTVAEAEARRLTRVFAQAPVGIALLRGPDHVFELANPSYRALIGARDVAGMPVREALPELAAQGIYELLDGVFATGEPYVGRSHRIFLQREPGRAPEESFFDFVYQPMRGPDGGVEGIAVVCFDVSDLTRARRDAVAANQAKDEFLAMLGHELRNPLAPIVTALQLMRLKGADGIEREQALIERQVKHLVGLVDDLLDVSRITSGKVELRRTHVELATVVSRAIEMASPLLEQQRHDLEVNVARAGLGVDADPGRLAQVVANLLTNAAKYTRAGGKISVVGRVEGDRIAVRVRDDGIGIEPDMLARIFEPFTQARQAIDRSRGGLGLGLTIVRSLVALHGGEVAVSSPGRGLGSEFVVRLPRVDVADHHREARPPDPGVHVEPDARRVLVVDDNEDAAVVLAEMLGLVGYNARYAHDGPSALRVAEEFAPDVAILDIGLPVMDGYELAQRFGEHPTLRRTRLVAVTGYGQDHDHARSRAAGFAAHLVKPVELLQLQPVLADLTRG